LRTKKKVIASGLLAVGFSLLSYWITNMDIPLSGEHVVLYNFELVRQYLFPTKKIAPDSILFVDVSYDKVFVPTYDKYGFVEGQRSITDRKKLIKLLQTLKQKNDYKYILLDVFFGDDIKTEDDSVLFHLIKTTPRLIIPRHEDAVLADSCLMEKSGMADYTTTYKFVTFSKYPYLPDGKVSLPLKMYEDIVHRKIKNWGICYTDGWRLARSSVILTQAVNINEPYDDNDTKVWFNLGADLLEDSIPRTHEVGNGLLWNRQFTKNKYVVVGALRSDADDQHTTYIGNLSGGLINMNAYIALCKGQHIVSIPLMLIMLFVFFCLSYLTLSRQGLKEVTAQMALGRHWALRIFLKALSGLCTWIGYSLFMTILCIVTYITIGEAYDIFITATFFSILNNIIKNIEYFKNIKLWNTKSK